MEHGGREESMFEQSRHRSETQVTRRIFLGVGTAAAVGAFLGFRHTPVAVAAKLEAPREITILQFSNAGEPLGPAKVMTIVKSDAEWKQQLSAAAYDITRRADTEMAYTGKYWNLHDKGLYRCIDCATALFSSATKFDSGTGWPSFWQPIAKENVREIHDASFGMERIAVACSRCDAHLGHVFDDGPQPTGLRYCMNSVALNFIKA
jgi:peptide-methionine (R)-S-oxide reductase